MPRALSAIMFFPRGGSAHAARGLAGELPRCGWQVRLVSGSRTDLAADADARSFYDGLDVHAIDYTDALRASRPVRHSGAGQAPMHPSYEDRPGAADPVFAALDDLDFERQVRAWGAALERAGARGCDVLHLHHLTPINEAAIRLAPDVPVIGQLHGTELLMLERIAAGPPPSWRHAARWRARMRAWAARCDRLLVAPGGVERALELLEVDRDRLVPLPNGFDPELFAPRRLARLEHWRRYLVEAPRGWRPGLQPGSIRYGEEDLRPFRTGVVLIYVGRFTEVKRLSLLIRAYAMARARLRVSAPLVLLGGHPGECEGEHPWEAIRRLRVPDVFLAGWHEHGELPSFLAASDLVVFPSVREQFGQALVEGMACGLPAVAASSFGARTIVEDGRTGWLVPPDDVEALAAAMVEAVNDEAERRRRGARAREAVLARYSLPRVAARVAALFERHTQPAEPPERAEHAAEALREAVEA
jgi:glycosyltransferase involved in cell wall biosynthesis